MTSIRHTQGSSNAMLSRRQACLLGSGALAGIAASLAGCSDAPGERAHANAGRDVDDIVQSMTLRQKVAQLIMPAIRTWEAEDNDVTDLGTVPGLAEALRRHQYGGIILFGSNIKSTEQTVRLISDLQANSAKGEDAQEGGAIPYLVAADQEGGWVSRLSMGTRGTGSMAIGATGSDGYQNARDTGTVFGLELAALGINVNLAPCADVIGDPADPGMATRVFSNDPEVVRNLAQGFAEGVAKSRVVTCFKHFPGAGDGSDDPTSESITLEDLRKQGLVPFSALVEDGADMVMTSAVTFPAFDDKHTLADGKTQGYYPATMSPKIVTDLLRKELGFDGVVITDALEMEQFVTEPDTGAQLLPGEPHSVEQGVEIAARCIAAGCDILLLPKDLRNAAASQWYTDYIAGIIDRVDSGAIATERIDESVRRILSLKKAFGVLDIELDGKSVDKAVSQASQIVGSAEHHAIERDIAEAAVTLLKGKDVLSIPGADVRLVILGRTKYDNNPISYALSELMESGVIDAKAYVDNRITGKATGDKAAPTQLYVDCYSDTDKGLMWSDDLSAAIAESDYVVCMASTPSGIDALQDADPRMQGISRALEEAHASGARFVIISNNLPVEGTRFPQADAVVCSYQSAGYDIEPTTEGTSGHMRAINVNAPAALRAIFGMTDMPGALPVDVFELQRDASGTWSYTDKVLFARGTSA